MKINLIPQRRDDTLSVVKSGDILVVNGEDFDFSRMTDGDTLPTTAIASPWFFGEVNRIDGELELTMFLPNPINYSPEQAFPVPLVNVPDGPVELPQPLPIPEPEVVDADFDTVPEPLLVENDSTPLIGHDPEEV